MSAEYQTEAWSNCAAHRAVVTNHLVQITKGRKKPLSLCVLGAGPCNDLDLDQLLEAYHHITLVDFNDQVLQDAIQKRGLADSPKLTLRTKLDLSGTHSEIVSQLNREDGEAFKQFLGQALNWRPDLQGPFDVVASTCLLSQFFEPLIQVLESHTDRLMHLLRAVRQRHLELLCELLDVGGNALLITDVTSSESLTALQEPNPNLSQLLTEHVLTGEHFHGLNPRAIEQEIEKNSLIQEKIHRHLVSEPWVWDATARKYLCLAFLLRGN